jgi:hypothetical protein
MLLSSKDGAYSYIFYEWEENLSGISAEMAKISEIISCGNEGNPCWDKLFIQLSLHYFPFYLVAGLIIIYIVKFHTVQR